MGIDSDFGWAFVKSQAGAAPSRPHPAPRFWRQVRDRAGALRCRPTVGCAGVPDHRHLGNGGVSDRAGGCKVDVVNKVQEGGRILSTISRTARWPWWSIPCGRRPRKPTRSPSGERPCTRVCPITITMRGALAAVMGIEALLKKGLAIRALQEYHPGKLSGARANRLAPRRTGAASRLNGPAWM